MAQQRLPWPCFILLSIFYATACTQDLSEPTPPRTNTASQSEQDYAILHPRNPRLTTKIFRSARELRALSMEENGFNPKISPYNYLGYSYKIGNGIIGHPENLGRPIINVEGMLNDPEFRDYILFNRVRYAHSEVHAYDSYDNFAQDSTITKRVKGGFKLNLGLFSIGTRKTYTTLFHSYHSSDKKTSAGSVDLFYYDAKVSLDNMRYAQQRIALSHLRKSFLMNLYNSTMSEIAEEYGTLAILGYYTGGRATARYSFEQEKYIDQTTTSKNINRYIGASVNWSLPNPSVSDSTWSARISIGNTNGDSIGSLRKYGFSKVYNQISLFGGTPHGVYSSPVKDATNNFMDLSAWLASLKDVKNHAFVDVTNHGLGSLGDFLLEKNFKVRFTKAMKGQESKELITPYIEITGGSCPTEFGSIHAYYAIVPTIHTRHGDIIALFDKGAKERIERVWNSNYNEEYEAYQQAVAEIDLLISPIFECEIRVKDHRGKGGFVTPNEEYNNYYLFFDFTSKEIYRYKNPKTNIWYIYDKSTKSAFSFYDDDYIPETYGIDRWFNSLPEKPISMRLLAERYTIIGL